MKKNPLLQLQALGQSVWMDFIRRETLLSGELSRLIEEDGLRGMTSNPTIFEKAIAGSDDYDDIRAMALKGKSVAEMYQALVVEDIQRAADLFRPVYERTEGRDGFVSLEVSPKLAHDTNGSIEEARLLWATVNRPNVMIKIPATSEGLAAIQQLISEGLNINITLLFGLPRYQQVIEAYLSGLEIRAGQGKPVQGVASVASFFLSRIDVLLDPMLEHELRADDPDVEKAGALLGRVAIASAKVAYQIYKEIFTSDRFRKLATQGARTQRLLWASTSTKNPAYSDVKYVEALIGPETINTMPIETINAYRDHGEPERRLTQGVAEARKMFQYLPDLGFDIDARTQQLEDEGVQKFIQAFDLLMRALNEKRTAALGGSVDRRMAMTT